MLGDHEKKWIPFRQVSGEDEDLSALGVPLDAVVKVDVGTRNWEVSKGGQIFVSQKYRGVQSIDFPFNYTVFEKVWRECGRIEKIGLTSSSV